MPIIKTRREDVMRNAEIDEMLENAKFGKVKYNKKVRWKRIDHPKFNTAMIRCLIALLWLFGKRITENLKLKRKDVRVNGNYLYVHYFVLKKKSRKLQVIAERRLKRITLENPYVKYVLEYVNTLADADDYLFPSRYSRSGHLSRQHVYRILKGLNSKAWPHLFRHSLATEMAERGATEEQLMAWFDWDRYTTAHRYVKGGPRLTEKWAKRTF